MNESNKQLVELGNKYQIQNSELLNKVKQKNKEIEKKNLELASVPWDRLNWPEQIDACYNILRSSP